MKIWKFPCNTPGPVEQPIVTFEIPKGGKLLQVAQQVHNQNWRLCLWFLVDPDGPKETRRFQVFRTDDDIPPERAYVGTAQTHGGHRVWHVFELPAAAETPAPPPEGQP